MFNKSNLFLILFLVILINSAFAQIEDVPISNSVYKFLLRLESLGMLNHHSLSKIPMQKNEIIEILKYARKNEASLSLTDKKILSEYEEEFEITKIDAATLIYSSTDSTQLFFDNLFGNKDKLLYRYRSEDKIDVRPLGSLDFIYAKMSDSSSKVMVGTLGIRLNGTISNTLGFYLQATNGRKIFGDKNLATYNPEYHKSVKFSRLNSDIDLTQSHVIFQSKWFRAKIGREEELLGAGLNQRAFISSYSPPMDAISLSAVFSNFRYDYCFASILGYAENQYETGFAAKIPSKYLNYHRFSVLPSWGEISFWEGIIYSERGLELAYLNPLSFFKSLEHQLHDRDNSLMGLDFTVRPISNLQIKSTFLLDDIIIEKIGTGYWSNKTAFNIATITTVVPNFDLGFEYARVEPYTFSHFNYQNAYTNDSLLIGSYLNPNSEQYSVLVNYWWGHKYPISAKLSFTRQGQNIYDANGKLIKNVGSDPFITRRNADPANGIDGDSETVTFLDGNLVKTFSFEITCGYELFKNFNIFISYQRLNDNSKNNDYFRLFLTLNEF